MREREREEKRDKEMSMETRMRNIERTNKER